MCLSCAGNKRKYMQQVHDVKGLAWTFGAISNQRYAGVPVRHILLDVMGFKESDLVGKGKHLVAVSLDADF